MRACRAIVHQNLVRDPDAFADDGAVPLAFQNEMHAPCLKYLDRA